MVCVIGIITSAGLKLKYNDLQVKSGSDGEILGVIILRTIPKT